MAFRTQRSPATGYAQAKNVAAQVKNYCVSRKAQFQGATNRDVVLSTNSDLIRWRAELASVASIPGIATYAQAQEDDPAYDVGAEFSGMTTAIDTVITEIVSAFPTANGAILEKALNPDGSVTHLTFTAAQLATLRTLLDGVIAAID